MTVKEKENPSKTLSKEMITQALLDLMKEKPYKEISITKIMERSGISRRTFYRHFTVVGDVLDYHIQKLCSQYVSLLLKPAEYNFKTFAFVYFSFWESYTDFLLDLEKNELTFLLLQKYNQYSAEICKAVFGDNYSSKPDYEYALIFNAGGFWNLHLRLLKDGAKITPAEAAGLAENILKFLNT